MIKALGLVKQQIEKINEHGKKAGFSSSLNDFQISYSLFNELKQLQTQLLQAKEKSNTTTTTSNKSKSNNNNNNNTTTPIIENDQQNILNFMNWLKSNGFDESKSKVKIGRNLAEGTGLIATSEIKEGEEFLEVPAKAMISIQSALKSFDKFGEVLLRDNLIKRSPTLILVLYLIREASNPESTIAPYIKVLPKTYNTVYYWSFEEFSQFIGSPTLDVAIRYTVSFMRQYCYLYSLFDNNPGLIQTTNFTWETFIWALSAVQSRQNPIYTKDGQEILALIPFWDFLNHTQGKITSFFDVQKESMTCAALKNYKPGEQVYMYYGSRSNSLLYIFQGFSIRTNLNDNYPLELELSTKDREVYHDKMHILEDKCGLRVGTEVTLSQNPSSDHLPVEAIPFYRIDALSDEEAKKMAPPQEKGHHHHHGHIDMKKGAFEIISEENEKRAFHHLLNTLKMKLSKYPTTLAEDEAEMKKNPTTQRRFILYILINEKKILERNIKYIEQLIEKGVMNANLKKLEFSEEEECNEDHGHDSCSGDHGDHGHSHGGHGHSHGDHGHSHGGHGHSHSGGSHGHSH